MSERKNIRKETYVDASTDEDIQRLADEHYGGSQSALIRDGIKQLINKLVEQE